MSEADQEEPPRPDTPPGGWDAWNGGADPGAAPPPLPRGMPDLAPLFEMLAVLRRSVPPELQEQIVTLQRELLLTARALIDWYLERLDQPDRSPSVEDIPID